MSPRTLVNLCREWIASGFVEYQSAARKNRGLAALLKMNTYLSDMRHYAGFDAVRRRILSVLPTPPASTCVGGAQFTTTGCCIEIEGIAVLAGQG